MSNIENNKTLSGWNTFTKTAFRIFSLYFLLMIVPLDWKFYKYLFSINWANAGYGEVFNLVHYTPRFFEGPDSYANWAVVFLVALAGAVVWTFLDRNRKTDYDNLSYWIRVIVRYRLAVGVIAYGFIKLFPLQSPYPSISNLNTNYGDFNRWKLFSMSLGIVPGYEFFLGLVEIVVGLLLLYRRTASIAAFIVLIFTGNVFVSNIAYDGGEQVYSFFLITLALFLLAFDLQRLTSLLILQKPTAPNRFKPLFDLPWKKYGRLALKISFILFFVVIYGFKVGGGYTKNGYQYPKEKGLNLLAGIYDVSEFVINRDTIHYSKVEPTRWQDVVFEKWNTISIRSNRPVIIDSTNTDNIYKDDKDRTYELQGAGGRHYYSYQADTLNHTLILNNRNTHYKGEKLVLHYTEPADNRIVLWGLNEKNDSIYVALTRINKKYLLKEVDQQGRNKKLKL